MKRKGWVAESARQRRIGRVAGWSGGRVVGWTGGSLLSYLLPFSLFSVCQVFSSLYQRELTRVQTVKEGISSSILQFLLQLCMSPCQSVGLSICLSVGRSVGRIGIWKSVPRDGDLLQNGQSAG